MPTELSATNSRAIHRWGSWVSNQRLSNRKAARSTRFQMDACRERSFLNVQHWAPQKHHEPTSIKAQARTAKQCFRFHWYSSGMFLLFDGIVLLSLSIWNERGKWVRTDRNTPVLWDLLKNESGIFHLKIYWFVWNRRREKGTMRSMYNLCRDGATSSVGHVFIVITLKNGFFLLLLDVIMLFVILTCIHFRFVVIDVSNVFFVHARLI